MGKLIELDKRLRTITPQRRVELLSEGALALYNLESRRLEREVVRLKRPERWDDLFEQFGREMGG